MAYIKMSSFDTLPDVEGEEYIVGISDLPSVKNVKIPVSKLKAYIEDNSGGGGTGDTLLAELTDSFFDI